MLARFGPGCPASVNETALEPCTREECACVRTSAVFARIQSYMATWTDDETTKLLEVWGDDDIQRQLQGCKRNRGIYEKLSREMAAAGYKREAVPCREKIKKLKAEYKKVKDNNSKTGSARKTTKFFEKVDEILGHRPATRPAVVIDTSSTTTSEDSSVTECSMVISDEEEGASSTHIDVNVSDDEQDVNQDAKDVKPKIMKKKCKRPAREEMMEKAMDTVMKKISDMQKESDACFIALEEKRMQLDEKMLEMEERERKEARDREERLCREEREFQMKILQLLSQQSVFRTPPPANYYTGASVTSRPGSGSMYEWPTDETQ